MRNVEDEKEIELKKMEQERKAETIGALKAMDIDDIKMGIGFCTPSWLQNFATAKMYLIVYCIVGLVIGMFFTYTVSVISTLEKRFKLTSKQTGIMLSGNDISQVLFATLVSYFGNYGNRPRWLGVGVLTASASCFFASIPHFIYGPGQDAIDFAESLSSLAAINSSTGLAVLNSDNKIDLCNSPYLEDCKEGSENSNYSVLGPLIILFMSQFCVGLAITTFYSLGLVYLDDNIEKKDSPLYYAISMIIRVVGPVLGFFMGSKCLSLYIDPRYNPSISQRDPRWLGAWWLGFEILGVLLFVSSFLIILFPRTLPITLYKQIRRAHKTESTDGLPLSKDADLGHLLKIAKTKQRHTKPSIRELPVALKRLLTNKVWLGYNFNTVFALLAMVGYWNFKPKYLEYQFRKSASTANFYTGVASLVASILGLSISGLIIKVFKPGPRFITAYSCCLTIFSALAMFSLMFIGCQKLNVLGPDFNSSSLANCNGGCDCTDRYSPVCSEDGLTTFYSPCYAGCTAVNTSAMPVEYLNCKCVSPLVLNNVSVHDSTHSSNVYEEISDSSSQVGEGKTIQGYCPEKCETFFYYIIITIITKTIDSTGRIGNTLIYMRCVAEHDKGLALGVSVVLLSLFSFIPGPIIMGAIVDSACIIWDNTCGRMGNCWLYDSDKFRYIIHGVPAIIILISLIGDIIVFVNSKDLVLYDDKDQDDIEGKHKEHHERRISDLMDVDNREMKLLNGGKG